MLHDFLPIARIECLFGTSRTLPALALATEPPLVAAQASVGIRPMFS